MSSNSIFRWGRRSDERIQNSEFRIRIRRNVPSPPFWILYSVFCILLPALCILLPAEIIDRIVITVGNQVITQSQVDDEIRVTAFLNREPWISAPTPRKAGGRQIDRTGADQARNGSQPLSAARNQRCRRIAAELKATYSSETDFQNALQASGITVDELTRRLWWQLTLLRFIDYRFRPGIQIPARMCKHIIDSKYPNGNKKGPSRFQPSRNLATRSRRS
jgi:hypothetical protein